MKEEKNTMGGDEKIDSSSIVGDEERPPFPAQRNSLFLCAAASGARDVNERWNGGEFGKIAKIVCDLQGTKRTNSPDEIVGANKLIDFRLSFTSAFGRFAAAERRVAKKRKKENWLIVYTHITLRRVL